MHVIIPQSQSYNEEGVSSQPTVPIPIPSYCYVLVSGPESVPIPCREEEEDLATFPTLTRPSTFSSVIVGGCDQEEGVTRVNLYARVVHYQPEVRRTVCG